MQKTVFSHYFHFVTVQPQHLTFALPYIILYTGAQYILIQYSIQIAPKVSAHSVYRAVFKIIVQYIYSNKIILSGSLIGIVQYMPQQDNFSGHLCLYISIVQYIYSKEFKLSLYTISIQDNDSPFKITAGNQDIICIQDNIIQYMRVQDNTIQYSI